MNGLTEASSGHYPTSNKCARDQDFHHRPASLFDLGRLEQISPFFADFRNTGFGEEAESMGLRYAETTYAYR
jgi:hypothetical protein